MIKLTLTAFCLSLLAGCASTHCIRFEQPRFVGCFVGGQLVTQGDAIELCQADKPDRWIVTTPSGQVSTMVGMQCAAAFDGRP